MKLSVIIPVYNEKDTVKKIVERVQAVDLVKEIILVDDYSTDGTREILPNFVSENIKVVLQEKNQGKGAAIREGVQHVSGDYVIIQDADLEYDPQDYLKLIIPVISGKAQIVYGSRFKGEHKFSTLSHLLGNKILTWLTNFLYQAILTDMETCYKLIPAKLLKEMPLRANRFDFEPEVTAKILKRGFKILELPISYSGREFHEGKKISWKDGFAAIWALLKYRFYD